MNYRHIYHAGNFADIFKHFLLFLTLRVLCQKEKGFLALDAFAGIGLYDLKSEPAQRTGEQETGITKLIHAAVQNDALKDFQDFMSRFYADGFYPGSPIILDRFLRPQDRLIVNELHPDDFMSLKLHLPPKITTRIHNEDAYIFLRSLLPPPERRGLILVDPPFEAKDEFEKLITQMREWKKRFATGVYMIWYPIKSHSPLQALHQAAIDLDINRTWVAEYLIHPRDKTDSFNGCGVLFLNTPYQIPEQLDAATAELTRCLGGQIESRYLVGG